ncbi:hypothetical protein WN943_022935 [Citrus x changshan-huyou]
MLQIATACVSDNPTVRPSMLHVQEFLENIIVEEHSEEIRIERGESSGTKDIYSRVELIVQESAVIESEKEVSMLMCSEDDRVNRGNSKEKPKANWNKQVDNIIAVPPCWYCRGIHFWSSLLRISSCR